MLYSGDNNLKDHPLQAFKASSNPDNMYLNEAMKDPDREEFITSMEKDTTYQMDNGNYDIIPMSQLPTGATILPEV